MTFWTLTDIWLNLTHNIAKGLQTWVLQCKNEWSIRTPISAQHGYILCEQAWTGRPLIQHFCARRELLDALIEIANASAMQPCHGRMRQTRLDMLWKACESSWESIQGSQMVPHLRHFHLGFAYKNPWDMEITIPHDQQVTVRSWIGPKSRYLHMQVPVAYSMDCYSDKYPQCYRMYDDFNVRANTTKHSIRTKVAWFTTPTTRIHGLSAFYLWIYQAQARKREKQCMWHKSRNSDTHGLVSEPWAALLINRLNEQERGQWKISRVMNKLAQAYLAKNGMIASKMSKSRRDLWALIAAEVYAQGAENDEWIIWSAWNLDKQVQIQSVNDPDC